MSEGRHKKCDIECWQERLDEFDGTQRDAKRIWNLIARDVLEYLVEGTNENNTNNKESAEVLRADA